MVQTGKSQDRRCMGRVRHRADVMVRGLSATFRRGSSRDFTEDGARLVVSEPVPPGHSVVVYLKLEAQRLLSVLATVVWSKPASEEGQTEVGIRFQDGCRADRVFLNNWLHRRRLLAYA